MLSLQNYGVEEPVYDDNAYSFTTVYHIGHLELYTTHPTAPTSVGGPAKYHMTQIGSYATTHNAERLREAAGAYRNARNTAEEMRSRHIKHANAVACEIQAGASQSRTPNQHRRSTPKTPAPEAESDTSVDELALSPAPSKRSRHEGPSSASQRSSPPRETLSASSPSADRAIVVADAPSGAPLGCPGQQKIAKKTVQVTTYKAEHNEKLGRVFQYDGDVVFVADEEWKAAMMSERPALLCDRYHVWCFE